MLDIEFNDKNANDFFKFLTKLYCIAVYIIKWNNESNCEINLFKLCPPLVQPRMACYFKVAISDWKSRFEMQVQVNSCTTLLGFEIYLCLSHPI